jgi:hypothetical protein
LIFGVINNGAFADEIQIHGPGTASLDIDHDGMLQPKQLEKALTES